MPPVSLPPEQPEPFRSALVNLVDRCRPPVRFAGLIDWQRLATAFGPLCREGVGRPGLPTRRMVGLHLIKHMDGLSDDAVRARFLDSPYVQRFCGETHFRHALPLDRFSMTRWRKRIGAEQLELLLAETLATAKRAGALPTSAHRHLSERSPEKAGARCADGRKPLQPDVCGGPR